MFEKTLTDVVKGIRASKRDTALYISQCIAEIKTEINSTDRYVKANALQKLTFLQMMGYSMGYASFATIEVMSSPRFAHKRIGYLAASQGFTQDTEVILLSTNLLKKELRGAVGGSMHGVYEAGLAINCISNIVTEELARDLLPEVTNLTTHPQPYLRKKAILCLFKLFVKYPQGLRLTFERIQNCLEDNNSSVVSCAVNVITELSDKNPKNYLHLAPQFFQLLTQSSNNWMLIKVVKLLGSLVPEEPRLARKLLEPLSDIVKNTQAKSLLYEAVRTITLCLPYCRKSDGSMPQNVPDIVELCARTLRDFVEQQDQNLKYLGLVGFGSLMQSHPRVLSAPNYRPLILTCLSDQDVTIRNRALDLLTGMASRKNLIELVTQLLKHVTFARGTYRNNLVAKIIEMCSGEKYALLQDFAWYLDILFQLGHMRGIETHGNLLRAQVTDVALRVLPVRPYAVRRSMEILLEGESDGDTSDDPYGDNGRGKHIMPQILPAIAWIIGEYSDLIREAMSIDPDEGVVEFTYNSKTKGTYHAVIQCLLDPMNTENLPATTQKVYVQSAMKVFAAAAADKEVKNDELEACVETIEGMMPVYIQSTDVEVAERSSTAMHLMESFDLCASSLDATRGSSFEVEDKNGDLLGIDPMAATVPVKKETKDETSILPLATRVRNSSQRLIFALKPAPMKPSGAKAQRKKRQGPVGLSIDVDSPVNVTIFDELAIEEENYIGKQMAVEKVSFTQQKLMKVEEPSMNGSSSAFGSSMAGPVQSGFGPDASTSFQHPVASNLLPSPRQRQGDPFYLASSTQNSNDEEDRRKENRFGTIQLLDSDDEAGDNQGRKKQKKKKQKKDKKNKATDAGFFDTFGEPEKPSASFNPPQVTLYDSDDDDDDDLQKRKSSTKKTGKEFQSLAMVDLTAPLREDEVMPERKHHVVPDRPAQPKREASKKEKKKEKKSKKDKKKSSKNDNVGAVGDLLDLGGGFSSDPVLPSTNTSTTLSGNAINLAFDDLFSASSPAPAPQLNPQSESMPAPDPFLSPVISSPEDGAKKKGKRPWIRATLKPSSAENGAVNWSQITVLIRSYKTKEGGGLAAMVVFRIENESAVTLNGVSIELKEHGNVSIGNIAPGGSSESAKIGPFSYSSGDSSQEIKGSIKTNDSKCSVKLHLPISLHFNPEAGIWLDQVAQELASSNWSSHSAKVALTTVTTPADVKEILCNFLRAAEVSGSAMTPATGTYAARSAGNDRVRMLVKVKDSTVKVDIKSTNDALAKSIASDVKRLVL